MALYQAVFEKLNEFMSNGCSMLLFVTALIFFALKDEKSRQTKRYLIFVLLIMAAALNPVTVWALSKSGYLDVMERFVWLMLTPAAVAAVFAVITQKKKEMLFPLCLLVVLCGSSAISKYEYTKAENVYKISEEAIEVSDMIIRDHEGLGADEEVAVNRRMDPSKCARAVITSPLCEDIRMYNSNICLWYVRDEFGSYWEKSYRKTASLVSKSNSLIPVDVVLKAMKKKKYDYLVLNDSQELTGDVDKYDLRVIGNTEHYTVYRFYPKVTYTVTHYADVEGYQCISYSIRSSDGRLIIVDGGRAWQSVSLVDEIEKMGGKVDAWILTHPHDDHCGVLASVLEAEWDKTKIQIDNIYMGEWDFDAVNAQGLRTDTVYYLMHNLETRPQYKVLHTGDEIDVCGLTLKVLHTCNAAVTENSDNILNDGSMVFKLSGEKSSILFLGDVADCSAEKRAAEGITDEKIGEGSAMGRMIADEILTAFPDDVKSTYVQMSHHGNSLLPDYFYEAVSPKAALFDAPDWLMENKNKETGESSYYTNPHYKALMESLGAEVITFSDTKTLTLR